MTPWTVAQQAPLSMGFSRPEHWSGLPFPSPGDLPNPGIKPRSPAFREGHFLKNFLEFVVIHTVKGYGIVNKAEIDVVLELSCFFHDPADVGNLFSGSSAFSKTSLNIRKFTPHIAEAWLGEF